MYFTQNTHALVWSFVLSAIVMGFCGWRKHNSDAFKNVLVYISKFNTKNPNEME